MSTRSVKQKIAAAVSTTSRSGATVTSAEAKEIAAEAQKGGLTTGEKKAVKDLFDHGKLTRAARGELSGVAGGSPPPGLAGLVPSAWRDAMASEIASPGFQALEKFLDEEDRIGAKVFPPRAQVFAALEATPPSKVKVVIIGQDPYPTAGNANGLAFSVNKGMPIPASLKNIFAGLKADTGAPIPKDGDLTPWAKEGVLLLNTVLTVREGEANSHHGKGWEPFTEGVLKKVNEQAGPVVFLCFGNQAKKMAESLVDTHKHAILAAPHPSPLNGRKFVETVEREHLFTQVNDALKAGGRSGVNWTLPN
jgi:uracil-DNA glycosylase